MSSLLDAVADWLHDRAPWTHAEGRAALQASYELPGCPEVVFRWPQNEMVARYADDDRQERPRYRYDRDTHAWEPCPAGGAGEE